MTTGIGSTTILIISMFLLIAGIMAIFIPFWVLRIRNEVIATNRNLERIAQLLGSKPPSAARPTSRQQTNQNIKLCPECGHRNAADEKVCISCLQQMK